MNTSHQLSLFPTQLRTNEVLTVHPETGFFSATQYVITNTLGNVMRKGSLASHCLDLQLRLVGLPPGLYHFIMGEEDMVFAVE